MFSLRPGVHATGRLSLAFCRPVAVKRHLRCKRLPNAVRCQKPDSSSDSTRSANAPESLVKAVDANGSKGLETRVEWYYLEKSILPKKEETLDSSQSENPATFHPQAIPKNARPFEITAARPVEVSKIREEVEEKEYDPLRDGPLRYLGYANELGEAFAAWLPVGGVPLSYAVAVGYVLFDTRDKGMKAYSTAEKELDGLDEEDVDTKRLTGLLAVERATDTVVWQLLASVIIPGYTIHTVVAMVHYLLERRLHIDEPMLMLPFVAASVSSMAATFHSNPDTICELIEKSVPTFCGLLTIPFIVHPIDETVHAILNVSMRPALRKFLCDNGQGFTAGLKICDETCMKTDFPVLSEGTNIIEAFSQSFDE